MIAPKIDGGVIMLFRFKRKAEVSTDLFKITFVRYH